ncbi:MAG: hypothetical protein ACXAD7_26060, partial [Candidatus Kariarchaeaceae archaeon]
MKDEINLKGLSQDSYVIIEHWGHCQICGKYDDLRYGVCFNCSDNVVTNGTEAWDTRNPSNRW